MSNLKERKYITINRVTNEGITQISGRLVECKGYEFCFCEGEDNYYLIELSTGFTVGSHNIQEWHKHYNREDAREALRDRVAIATNEDFKKGIDKAIAVLNENGYDYPVNKPINL
ncbi:hypothetical protein [Bacteroides sp. 51]|uniref:hypothetical protein n=1 Tax=Bacteroides sp. 51 TaxID=2302938 RepID=UPI0013D5A6EC|nr:hypothetical protein [Bacteroides sp. 51]NDV83386.1 hypothetical protein [Bacteroides sp. 51]